MIKKYIEKIVGKFAESGYKSLSCVFCEDCGVVVKKDKAYKVIVKDPFSPKVDEYLTRYYCDRHRKDYDRVEMPHSSYYTYLDSSEPETTYYKDNVEVDKNGKIITKRKP